MTQLELINAALDQIGSSILTAAQFAAGTELRAAAAIRQWPMALSEFLSDHPWKFAKTRTELTAEVSSPAFGWAYAYELPADFVTLVALNEDELGSGSDLFEIEGNYLLTHVSAAQIEYIATPGSGTLAAFLNRMDSKAQAAFVYLLASKLATPIAKDGAQLSLTLYQLYKRIVNEARVKNFNEAKPAILDESEDSRVIAARGVSGVQQGNIPGRDIRVTVPHVDVISDLDALGAMADGAVVLVLGFYAIGDTGGGFWVYDEDSEATVDGGSVRAYSTGTGRWLKVDV